MGDICLDLHLLHICDYYVIRFKHLCQACGIDVVILSMLMKTALKKSKRNFPNCRDFKTCRRKAMSQQSKTMSDVLQKTDQTLEQARAMVSGVLDYVHKDDWTAVSTAAMAKPATDSKALQLLSDAGADLEVLLRKGQTALLRAA